MTIEYDTPNARLTPERIAKGDMEYSLYANGSIRYAQVHDRSVLAWLIERGTLDDLHGTYATIFLDLRHYFLRKVAYKGNSIYAAEFFSTSNSGVLETIYVRVMRFLDRDSERLIFHAIGARFHERDVPCLAPWGKRYRAAFERLVEAVDEARRLTKTACETD